MRVQFLPTLGCNNLIKKCISKVSSKKHRLGFITQDEFYFKGEEVEVLNAKIKYFHDAIRYKRDVLKKVPPEKRNKSEINKCIKTIRKEIWSCEKRLKNLGIW